MEGGSLIHIQMNISTIFNIVSSIATAVSAVLVYVTLREMKKQRDTEYKPIIVIRTKAEVEFSSQKGVSNPERMAKTKNYNGHEMKIMGKGSETIIFKIVNIGRGPANKIQYKINEADLIHFFEVEAMNNGDFYFVNEPASKQIKYGYRANKYFTWEYYEYKTTSYLLPGGNDVFEMYLPYSLIHILSNSLKNGYNGSFERFKIRIECNYEDIQSNSFSKTISIHFTERFYMKEIYDSNGDIPDEKQEKSALYRIDLKY